MFSNVTGASIEQMAIHISFDAPFKWRIINNRVKAFLTKRKFFA
jgi:hypothetical protein